MEEISPALTALHGHAALIFRKLDEFHHCKDIVSERIIGQAKREEFLEFLEKSCSDAK